MRFNSFMAEAIKEAKKAKETGEVPVGAIIVENNKIIARAHNKNIFHKDSTSHAEILAIRKACTAKNSHRLDNCDLYVTLEPCKMCYGAISLARIKRVYFGAVDKKTDKELTHKPEIYSEIASKECEELLTEFFKNKRP